MIDILIPVLDRPENAVRVVASIEMNTQVDHSIVFLCSEGDTAQIEACKHSGARVVVADFGTHSQYPKKMNRGFELTDRDFVLLGADDLDFQPGWDMQALRVACEQKASVIGTDDCANPQVKRGEFSTHALVRRRYVTEQGASLDGPGILISEAYDHNYCDRELCHLAQARGIWAFASESKIVHRHPAWGTAPRDETYTRGMRLMRKDHARFMRRAEQWGGVGLLPEEQRRRGRRRR